MAVVAYRIEDYVQLVIYFPLLFMKIFALADAIYRKDAFYVAADKQNKAFWIDPAGGLPRPADPSCTRLSSC